METPWSHSQPGPAAGAGHLPGALRTALPPLDQPGEPGALRHGVAPPTCRTKTAPIARAVAGTSTERLQHLLTDAVWEPQALDQQRVRALWRRVLPRAFCAGRHRTAQARARSSAWPTRMPGHWARAPIARSLSARTTWRMSRPAAPRALALTAQLYLPEAWATDRAAGPRSGSRRRSLSDEARAGARLLDQARAWASRSPRSSPTPRRRHPHLPAGARRPTRRLRRGRERHLWGAPAGRGRAAALVPRRAPAAR